MKNSSLRQKFSNIFICLSVPLIDLKDYRIPRREVRIYFRKIDLFSVEVISPGDDSDGVGAVVDDVHTEDSVLTQSCLPAGPSLRIDVARAEGS